MNARALALAFVLAPSVARADDFVLDARFPVRAGFAWSGLTRAPAFALSLSTEADVARLAPRLALTIALDVDSFTRPDLPSEDPRSSFGGIGAGVGLFWVTEGDVAFGIESSPSVVFDNKDLVGGGFSARAFVVPFYVPLERATKGGGDTFGAWVRSAISLWVEGRADFTSDGNGGSFAFGASFDVARIIFLPYIFALEKMLR